jgi:predicted nucleic-acid-binding Zn-ribbon protein
MVSVYLKKCPRCHGDVVNQHGEFVCFQCGNRNFSKANLLMSLLTEIKKKGGVRSKYAS